MLGAYTPLACFLPFPATQYTFPKDIGAAVRENVVRAPGPGHYNMHPGVGKQVCDSVTGSIGLLGEE